MTRLRNMLCGLLSLLLLGIYYRFPIGHMSSQQTTWLVVKIMVMVFAAALAFEWLGTLSEQRSPHVRAAKTGYADPAPSA